MRDVIIQGAALINRKEPEPCEIRRQPEYSKGAERASLHPADASKL